MKAYIHKFFRFIVVAILSVVSVIGGQANLFALPVYAEETVNERVYSAVLCDLKKDTSFNTENYPTKADDYSLQIIQLAESSDKELFVYVYQPSGKAKDFKASSINISTTINDSISYHNFKLDFLNSDGVFYKYSVIGLTVKDDTVRYYAISSIYRPFDESIDDAASGGNTVTEVNYAVNKQYCFGEINGKPYVNCVDIETIVVTDKFVGFVRYPGGFNLFQPMGACDSHFVAFNTDKPIDKLLEADVYYTTQNMACDFFESEDSSFKTEFGEKKMDNYAYLKYTEKVKYTGDGLFAGTYKWDRIQTVEDFIANENKDNIYHGAVFGVKYSSKLDDAAMSELKGKKWVLRFVETNYTKDPRSGMGAATYYHSDSTIVGDVTILRLKFETDGITYNLGTIDNKQSGSDDPVNDTDISIKLPDGLERIFTLIFGALLLIVLLVVLMPILPTIISLAIKIVLLPCRAIASLFKAIFHKRK